MEIPQALPENVHMEYVVEMNQNDELNLSNFAQYTLVPQEETEMVSGEIVNRIPDEAHVKSSDTESWHENLTSEALTETESSSKPQDSTSIWTPGQISMLKEFDRYIKPENSRPQCHGQGDGPNSPLLTPTVLHHVVKSETNQEFTVQLEPITGSSTTQEDGNRLIYATLESARESCVNYDTPQFTCRFPPIIQAFQAPQVEPSRLETYTPRAMVTKPLPVRGFRPRQIGKTPIMPPYVIRAPVPPTACNSTDRSSDFSFSSPSPQFPGNSSNSVGSDTSPEYPNPPNNTPNTADNEDSSPMASLCPNRFLTRSQLNSRLERLSHFPHTMDVRAIHNAKERKRRSRIRDACQAMRRLLPGVSERTDNASVFEQFANYINFLKSHVGDHYDMDYLREYQLTKDKYHTLTFSAKLECNK